MRTTGAIDDRSGRDPYLRAEPVATVVVRGRLAGFEQRLMPQRSAGVCVEGVHTVIFGDGVDDIVCSLPWD